MVHVILIANLLLALWSCGQVSPDRENIAPEVASVSDPCNDPDAGIHCYFLNMPSDLSHVMEIPFGDETADKLIITGVLYMPDGTTPWPDVILYAYHTDGKGYYSKNGNEKGVQKWHGKLHGWCKTDSNGRYEIRTIRPAPYPGNRIPAHIHAAVKKPDGKAMHINDFVFSDDKLVGKAYTARLNLDAGGTGILELERNDEGWFGKRDIILKD